MSWGLDLSGSLAYKLYTGPPRNKFSRGKTAEMKRLITPGAPNGATLSAFWCSIRQAWTRSAWPAALHSWP